MDSFIQITVFCPPEPRVGAFVHWNAGKVYYHNALGLCFRVQIKAILLYMRRWNYEVWIRMAKPIGFWSL